MAIIKNIFAFILFLASVGAVDQNVDSVVHRVSNIAEKYSNWALGKTSIERPVVSNYHVTQMQPPPRYFNPAPVKQFFHPVRIQTPPPDPKLFRSPEYVYAMPTGIVLTTTPSPVFTSSHRPIQFASFPRNVTSAPFFYQQIPPPIRLSELPRESSQRYHFPSKPQPPKEFVSVNPNFPRLLESEVPMRTPPTFSSNSSVFPSHMSQSFGSSILSQLLPPILEEPLTPAPSLPPPPATQFHVNPNVLPISSNQEPSKEDVLKVASKKRLFGFPRFPMEPQREFFQGGGCLSGWCGGECCESRQQFSQVSTTIQATALPGSPGPSHPLVLVVHPSPALNTQCVPACQPHCNQQCVARLQYMQEAHFYNSINEPTCRPDCMPSCHVDCLIIPPQRVRCNHFNCQCLAGYVQCAAFTCCMRYPNMAAKMKSNVAAKSSEEAETIEDHQDNTDRNGNRRRMYTPTQTLKRLEERIKHDIEDVTPMPTYKPSYWTKKKIASVSVEKPAPCVTTTPVTTTTSTTSSTTTPTTTPVPTTTRTTTVPPTTTSSTTTTTTTTPPPTTTTTTTTTTTSSPPTTSSTAPTTTTRASTHIMNFTPVYPDMLKTHKIPMIPAYGLWKIPQTPRFEPENEQRNSVGDIKGRHVIRSENFLDVLSELAQVKLKEDITNDFSQAATFIEFMTDRIRKL